MASRGELCAFFILHILLQIPVHFSVLHLSLMRTPGIDHLLFYTMKSSIPGADLISFRKGIVTVDVYVHFSWFISVWKTAGEELGSGNELWLLCSIVGHCKHVLTLNQVRDKSYWHYWFVNSYILWQQKWKPENWFYHCYRAEFPTLLFSSTLFEIHLSHASAHISIKSYCRRKDLCSPLHVSWTGNLKGCMIL